MSKKGHVPIRMCIGCRKKRKKDDMVRLIIGFDGILFSDHKKNLNGRGYYLCPDRSCLKLAQKKHRGLESFESMGPLGSSMEGCII